MHDHSGDLGVIARHWFEFMRACGDDVRELLHDGHPTACVGDAAFAYVNAFKAHVNVGFSIDQSHTKIDVPLAMQTATLDLTQLGFSAAVDKGPWTWAIALVHGFGNIGSSRDTGFGFANASYNARIDGALTELDYYWTKGQSRFRAP